MNSSTTFLLGLALAIVAGAGYLIASASPATSGDAPEAATGTPTVWVTSARFDSIATVCIGPNLEKGIEVTLSFVNKDESDGGLSAWSTKKYVDPLSTDPVDFQLVEVIPYVEWGMISSDDELEIQRIEVE